MSATDRCWRVVLGTPQGGLQQFRGRLIRQDMDRRLLERTVEVAKRTKAFDWKKLPATLCLAVDSRPLEGAGRAGKKLAEGAARLMGTDMEEGAVRRRCCWAPA